MGPINQHFLALPLELRFSIVQSLDDESLPSLVQTCLQFRREVYSFKSLRNRLVWLEINKIIAQIKEEDLSLEKIAIVKALCNHGKLDLAQALAESISDLANKGIATKIVILEMISKGEIEKTKILVQNSHWFEGALVTFIKGRIALGDLPVSVKLAETLPDKYHTELFLAFMYAYAKKGDLEGVMYASTFCENRSFDISLAQATAQTVNNPSDNALKKLMEEVLTWEDPISLGQIAEAQMSISDRDGAILTLSIMLDLDANHSLDEDIKIDLAWYQAKCSDIEGAMRTYVSVLDSLKSRDKYFQLRRIKKIAQDQRDLGLIKESSATFDRILSFNFSDGFESVAEYQLNLGFIDKAKETLALSEEEHLDLSKKIAIKETIREIEKPKGDIDSMEPWAKVLGLLALLGESNAAH